MNPHRVTQDFEQALCEYTGAPYAVAVNSCTMALLLAVAWHHRNTPKTGQVTWMEDGTVKVAAGFLVNIPKRTYISVPMSIIHAGGRPTFRDEEWLGAYQLKPLPVFDSARWFTFGMYNGAHHKAAKGAYVMGPLDLPEAAALIGGTSIPVVFSGMVCVSFHASKTLGLEQGGAILHDNPEADAWLRRARFDGRTEGVAPKDDDFNMIAWHAYMNPSTAAQGILRLHSLPRHNVPLENDNYPDLSTMEIFK